MSGDTPFFEVGRGVVAAFAALWLAGGNVCEAAPAASNLDQASHLPARNARGATHGVAATRKPDAAPWENEEAPQRAAPSRNAEAGNLYHVRHPNQPDIKTSRFEGGRFKIFLEEADSEGNADAVAWTTLVGPGVSFTCTGFLRTCFTYLPPGDYQISVNCRCEAEMALMILRSERAEPLARETARSSAYKNRAPASAQPGEAIGAARH